MKKAVGNLSAVQNIAARWQTKTIHLGSTRAALIIHFDVISRITIPIESLAFYFEHDPGIFIVAPLFIGVIFSGEQDPHCARCDARVAELFITIGLSRRGRVRGERSTGTCWL